MKRFFLMFLFCLVNYSAFAADPLRDYLQEQTRYWGVEKTMSTADLDMLVELKRKADLPGLNQEERTKAYTDLFHFVQKLRGIPEGRVPGAMAAMYWSDGASFMPPALPSAKPRQLGNFKKRGSGKVPMILIPDIGSDWSVFDSFMQRNQTQFTFYALTLPGFSGTNPPPRPERLDFGKMKWWNNAADAVLDLMAREKMDRPVILGHQAGAYIAMKLALQHPERIRGAIVLNGLLSAVIPGMPQNATISERVSFVNRLAPAELFPYPTPEKYFQVMMQNASWFCKNKERQEYIARLMTVGAARVWWNYFAELATTDLTAEIKNLKVPMLVLPSIHDHDSPGFESSRVTLDQWASLEPSKGSLPITIVRMEDCRAYATEDQPAKLDEVIRQWTTTFKSRS